MGSITQNSAEINQSSKKGLLSKMNMSFRSTGTGAPSKSGGASKTAPAGKPKNGLSRSFQKSGSVNPSISKAQKRGSQGDEPVFDMGPVSGPLAGGIPTSITALVDCSGSVVTMDTGIGTQRTQPDILGLEPRRRKTNAYAYDDVGPPTSDSAQRALANLHVGDSPGYSNYSLNDNYGNGHMDYKDTGGGGIFDNSYMPAGNRSGGAGGGGYRRPTTASAQSTPVMRSTPSRSMPTSRRTSSAEEYQNYRRTSSDNAQTSRGMSGSIHEGDPYHNVGRKMPRNGSMDHSCGSAGSGNRRAPMASSMRRASVEYDPRNVPTGHQQGYRNSMGHNSYPSAGESEETRQQSNIVNNTGRNSTTGSAEFQSQRRATQASAMSNWENPAVASRPKGMSDSLRRTQQQNRYGGDDDDVTMVTMETKAQALQPSAINKAKDMSYPQGDVTIVYTDVQGSTSMWETCPSDMKKATDIHDMIMRQCYTNHSGYEVNTEGDAFNLAFQHPVDALAFALQAQLKLYKADWPEGILKHPDGKEEPALKFKGFRVRFGIHHGPTNSRVHEMTGRMIYSGEGVKISKAVEGMCHGGQILTTMETWKAVSGMAERYLGRPQILDCGEHLLFETKNSNPNFPAGGFTTTRYTRRIMQLVPSDLAFDFFEARGRRDVPSEDGKMGFEIKDASAVAGRLFPPLTSKRQLTTCFLNAPYANGRVTICFVYTVGLEDSSNPAIRSQNHEVLAKYLRKQLLMLNPPGYECQEDNGCWMLAFDRMAHAVTFGLQLKSTLQPGVTDLAGNHDLVNMFKVGILSGPFTSMGPHKTTGMADYFGPIVNRAARVASNCEPGQVCVGIPLSNGVSADPPDFGPTVNVRMQGIKKLKGITIDVAIFNITKRMIETIY